MSLKMCTSMNSLHWNTGHTEHYILSAVFILKRNTANFALQAVLLHGHKSGLKNFLKGKHLMHCLFQPLQYLSTIHDRDGWVPYYSSGLPNEMMNENAK